MSEAELKNNEQPKSKSRRWFLKTLGVAGGGLIVGVTINRFLPKPPPFEPANGAMAPNAFLQITPDSQIKFYMPVQEMGQGVYTGLTTLVAEELGVHPDSIHVISAEPHGAYKNPDFGMMGTGGSTSMRLFYQPIRQAAANARAALLNAAAQQLSVAVSALSMNDGSISTGGRSYALGEFTGLAATLPVPEDAPLKPANEFRYIGQFNQRLDAVAKSSGEAEFGIDVEVPGLMRAVMVRCPVDGGTVKSLDDTAVKGLPGVKHIVTLDHGVAVVAESYWEAKKASQALNIEWNLPELARYSSDTIYEEFVQALDEEGDEAALVGSGESALVNAAKTIEADYWAPYLSHSPMEPLNCTVKIQDNKCEVWAGNQSPEMVRGVAGLYSGVSEKNITVHTPFLGGGFGRRFFSDFVAEAVQIAKASNHPVQLVWSREDDTQHDFFRPASLARMKAGLTADGELETWSVKHVGPNIMPYLLDQVVDVMVPGITPDGVADWLSKRGFWLFDGKQVDPSSVEGFHEDYAIANKEVRNVTRDPGLRVGFWRSVGHSYTGFFKESFMDEIAHATGKDPLEIRLERTSENKRLQNVVKVVGNLSNWGRPSAPNHYQGIGVHHSFESDVAQVAEVSVDGGKIRVHKVTCVVNCGLAVNPDIVKAQMESSIVFGLTAALHGEITLKDGVVQQSNFHDYPMLRMSEVPEIVVHIIESDDAPRGVGEPGLPPIAAAVGNAVFAATGQRLRSLPLRLA